MRNRLLPAGLVAQMLGGFLFVGCHPIMTPLPVTRSGDEIVVAGKFYHAGTRVITWTDPGGYDAYRGAPTLSSRQPHRAQGQAQGWDLATLQVTVDQFVLHYDGHGLSKLCFQVLQQRELSVHFLLDLDGTIYQTLDLQERAQHATTVNDRSIGIEIANLGAFPPGDTRELDTWYQRDAQGAIHLRVPSQVGNAKILTVPFVGRPARPNLVRGPVQGTEMIQYDFTPEQYAALIKLTAALCQLFPQIKCDYPRDAAGQLITHKLPDDDLASYRGILGHYHIQSNKTDPGPAFQWDKLIEGARQRLK